MARNLRSKLPIDDTLIVQDVNTAATAQFLNENPEGVRVADTAREVAEKSVGNVFCYPTSLYFRIPYDEQIVLSMI